MTMEFIDTLVERNADFVRSGIDPKLKMIPSRRTMIIGCVDPRVDPMELFKLQSGEAAIIRNVGGRVTPSVFETMGILRVVSRVAGEEVGSGWNLIVLHHTDCGITHCFNHAPEILAKHMGVSVDDLSGLAITDPFKAVTIDVAKLKSNPNLPGGFLVSGLVYDVATGKVETIVPPDLLRPDEI
jgi:carbonic anhydrase